MLSPLDPRCPLDNDMLLLTYTKYVKGVLGLEGKEIEQAKELIKHLTRIDRFARWSFLMYINGINLVRPGNGRWACQTEHCHSLSI